MSEREASSEHDTERSFQGVDSRDVALQACLGRASALLRSSCHETTGEGFIEADIIRTVLHPL